MSALEAVSYLLFLIYLASFFALSAYAAHQAGRSIWLFGKGAEKQGLPALLFRVAFAGAALWPLMDAAVGPWPAGDVLRAVFDGVAFDSLGHLLVAVGAIIAIASQTAMGASWRIGAAAGETGPIVTDGPFAVSRNPVFVGQAVLFAGLFLVFPGLVQALLTAALIVAIHLQVRIEEKVLAETLGEPYLAYMARVSRWIGVRAS
jgi:protein-S-isoprenylcysteine O-methyltransferase Ste14